MQGQSESQTNKGKFLSAREFKYSCISHMLQHLRFCTSYTQKSNIQLIPMLQPFLFKIGKLTVSFSSRGSFVNFESKSRGNIRYLLCFLGIKVAFPIFCGRTNNIF